MIVCLKERPSLFRSSTGFAIVECKTRTGQGSPRILLPKFNIPWSEPRSHRQARVWNVSWILGLWYSCNTYQVAHNDFWGSSSISWPAWHDLSTCSTSVPCRSMILLDASDRRRDISLAGIGISITSTSTAPCGMTTRAENLVKRLIKFSRHDSWADLNLVRFERRGRELNPEAMSRNKNDQWVQDCQAGWDKRGQCENLGERSDDRKVSVVS